ncbi:rhomboid family intramembrane serine protease [Rubellimicrobium roseum]|uniref:Rhomboid family intramembrane serine protease n=1 Tax=Rubellimicrobium roseum TaxID=687525 RepID=A0A5C4NEE2_9RHOB|nr:rhomboid family intramembrane serine protease [Rubellimicrobium roseum]TNC73013.1 rhomboid family intramembrane serine protease [Rubellimicrobium roseum]
MARSFQRPLPEPVPGQSPVNPVPPAVVALVLVLGLTEAALSLGGAGLAGGPGAVGWRVALIERFAVSPAVVDYALMGRWDGPLLLRFVAYPFVHGSVMHALFAGALLLALGKFVAEGMGQAAALAVFVAGTVGGALGFGLLLDGAQPLFGAYPGIYGLIGAFTYLTWLRLGQVGENRLMAFRMIGMLLAIQLVFAALFGGSPQWVGDVAGFVAGGLAAVAVAPGGLRALRARLRAR